MTNKQKLKAARKKLNYKFPMHFNVFYYKGLKITRQMYFGYDVREVKQVEDYNFYSPNERYEYMAMLFYKSTGMLAPGKDDILSTTPRETRESEWALFLDNYYAESAKAHYEKNNIEKQTGVK